MKLLFIGAGFVLAVVIAGVLVVKRKLSSMGEGLPGALQQWQKEIEKLEKPKG